MISLLNHWKLLAISFVVANSAMFQFGYVPVYVSTAQAALTVFVNESYHDQHDSYLTEQEFFWIWSFIVNCYQLGFFVGVVATPFCVEKLGRKWTLIATSVFDVLGSVLSIIAVPLNMPLLLSIGRLIIGIGSGISSSAITLYLQEISPTNLRGAVSSFQELSVSMVSILGTVMGLPTVLGNQNSLCYLFGVSLVPAIPKLLLLFCPETPKYLLIKKNREITSRESIKFYHGPTANVDYVISEIRKESQLEHSTSNKLKLIFRTAHFRKAVILGSVVFIAQETTGIVPMLEYITYLLEDIKCTQKLAFAATVATTIGNTLTTALSLWLVEKYGRRKLLLTSFSCIIFILALFTACFFIASDISALWPVYSAAALVVIYAMVFGFGPGPVPWFITAELVPQSVRSTAQSISQIVNIIITFIVSFAFLPLYGATGAYSYIILFIVPTALCIAYLYFELPETRNREISDIVMDLQKSTVKNPIKVDLSFREKF